jgi:ferredoxin, 2Fe-2S
MEDQTGHSVEVLPIGHTFLVPDGGSIMVVALASGWKWPNVCGGQATCGVCLLEVQEGEEFASAIGRDEALRLAFNGKAGNPRARLACQLRIHGPMRVFKRGVRLLEGQLTQSCKDNTG